MNEPGISPKQIAVLSVSAGVCVANIYYNQPILADIARDTGSTQQATGYLPVLTQAGYGLGLLLLTPLGDKTDRKRLILLLQAGLAVVLLLVTQVQSLPAFYALSFAIGLFAVATQVIMPMAKLRA
ncbi:MAG: MFS transporter [Chitinophagaceae bacterium]|nr:MAG: MFS transporter [Chitinophagaceae bacterium]